VLVLALTGQNFIADDEQTKCHAGLSSRSCTSMRSQHSGVLPINNEGGRSRLRCLN
jgi:hypothetical protein